MFAVDQPYTIVLIASVIISLSMAVAVLLHKRTLGVYAFALLKASIGLWAFTSLFEVCSLHIETKVVAYSFKYLFVVTVPIAWFLFGLYYSNRLTEIKRSQIALLAIIPLITVLLVVTNRYHHWMFISLEVIETDVYLFIVRKFGPWFWIHAGYSYVLLFLGFLFMVKHLIVSPSYYRWQVAALLVGGLTPWIANMVHTFNLMSCPYLDLTPFAFTVSGLAFMVGIVRFQLLDVMPIAQDVVIENIDDSIIVLDNEYRILNLNPAANRLVDTQRPKLIGAKAEEIFSWWDKLDLDNEQATGPELPILYLNIEKQRRLLRPKRLPLYCKDRVTGLLITLHDITEEHDLQNQLFQSQKMEAIGTLAGGIAHDFNNLLMGMQANLSLMHPGSATGPTFQEIITRIEDQIKSGANLTRQLLGYARKGKYVTTTVHLNRLIEESLTIVQRTNKAITIKKLLSDDPVLIKADRGQIEMVLLNLFVNAVDAMPQGGRLTVSTRHANKSDFKKYGDRYVHFCEMIVADTGIGMDAATQKRIFEPFFTTKEKGHGTGLGLASVYGVIQNHNGQIQVESTKGQGTMFTIYLPTTCEEVLKQEAPKQVALPAKGTTVLLVEDEPLICKYCLELIRSLDLSVLAAQNGQEAIDIYQAHHTDIDLVILDMIMPGMDGISVYKALSQINSDLRVIITSGYAHDERVDQILSQGNHASLQKPYTRDELVDKITTVLSPEPFGCRNSPAETA